MLKIYSATHSYVPLMEIDVYKEQTEGFNLHSFPTAPLLSFCSTCLYFGDPP